MTAVAEDYVHAGYDLSAAAILLCESDGTPEEVAEEIAAHERACWRKAAPRRIEVSQRRGAAAASSGADARTPSRPRAASARTTCAWIRPFRASGSPRCCSPSRPWRRKYQLRCVNVFHAGDGNLHPLILFDANDPRRIQALRAVRRGDPRGQRAARRHRDRGARRRRREAQLDVRAVLARRAGAVRRRQARLRPRRSC